MKSKGILRRLAAWTYSVIPAVTLFSVILED